MFAIRSRVPLPFMNRAFLSNCQQSLHFHCFQAGTSLATQIKQVFVTCKEPWCICWGYKHESNMTSTFKGAKSQVTEMSHVPTKQNRKRHHKPHLDTVLRQLIISDTKGLRKLHADGSLSEHGRAGNVCLHIRIKNTRLGAD